MGEKRHIFFQHHHILAGQGAGRAPEGGKVNRRFQPEKKRPGQVQQKAEREQQGKTASFTQLLP